MLPGCPITLDIPRPSSALSGIDLASLVENADPAETRRVLDWLEQQAVKLHALLATPDLPAPAIAHGVVPDRGRRLRRPKQPVALHV